MAKEIEVGDTSVEMFDRLINGRYPIVSITGATYIPREHGLASINKPLQNDKIYLFETHVDRHLQPLIDRLYLKEKEVFAIGSLLHVRPREMKTGRRNMSFLMMDFDCKKDPAILNEIVTVVKSSCKNSPFSIIESDNSYHLVFDDIISPINITWHLGKLIYILSDLESDTKKQVIKQYGLNIQKYHKSPNTIREISNQALKTFNHEDEITDKRWVSHTLLELMDHLMKNKEVSINYPYSFGFIRVTPKKDFKPVVVGRQV